MVIGQIRKQIIKYLTSFSYNICLKFLHLGRSSELSFLKSAFLYTFKLVEKWKTLNWDYC